MQDAVVWIFLQIQMKLSRKTNKYRIASSEDQSFPGNFWIVAVLLVVLLAVAPNYVTVDGTFVFDDRESILKNEDVYNLNIPIEEIFAHDFWGSNITSKLSHKSYRPLTIMAFRMQYDFVGQLDPRIFHTINIVLHVINSLLSLVVIIVILSEGEHCGNLRSETKEGILLASSLFAVHPIHTESVAAVVGQADMLYTLFSLKAFLLYHYALTRDKYQTDNSPLSNLMYILGVSFLTVLSLLCKEQGLMTTVMCALYDILLHQKDIFQFLMKSSKSKEAKYAQLPQRNVRNIFLNLVLRLSSLTIVTAMLLLFRLYLMVSQPAFSRHDNPQSFVENFMLRVLNYCYLYWLNAWILLNPLWLCCDWSNNCVSILESFQDFRSLIILVFLVILTLLAFATVKCWNTPRSRKLVAAYIFLFIPFLPASNIFFRVGFVIAERNLYLPCLGFSLLVAIGYCALSNHCTLHLQSLRKFAIFLIIILTIRSHMRNRDWLNADSLYRSGLKVCPNNAKLYYNIGSDYLHKNDLEPAKDYFHETIRKNPEFASAYNGLGDCYLDQGKLTIAEKYYLKAVSISVVKEAPLLNLCYTRFKLKKMAEAKDCVNTIIREYPSSADRGYYGLAEIFYHSGDHVKALEAWIKATEKNSTYTEAWISVIVSLYKLGRREESEKMFRKSLSLVPNPASLHFIWARIHEGTQFYTAEEHYKKAISYDPENQSYKDKLLSFYKKRKLN